METASFGSRGCILQGKVALCPATPCIDSMGTVTHSWRGVVEKFFFFFFFSPAIERKNYGDGGGGIMIISKKKKERGWSRIKEKR